MKMAVLLPLGFLLASPSMAADIYTPVAPEAKTVEAEGWTFTVAPYFWMAGLSGDVAQFGSPTIHIDQSFSDIIKDFDIGGMAIAEARRGRFSIFGDVMYTKVSSGAGTPRGILADSVEVESETFTGLVGAGYSVIDNSVGRLDLVAGVRIWSVDTNLSFNGGILDDVSLDDGATWADAMGGVRAQYSFTPRIYVTGWGLVGAGEADIDWDVAAAFGYRFNNRFSALAGYRALGVDYSKDGFVFDVVEQGPILGLSMHF